MSLSTNTIISSLVSASNPVLKINEVGGRQWYRKPKDGRRGPWLSAQFEFLDKAIWERRGPCIYFVTDQNEVLRYVGISLNKLSDRWRTSPAFTESDEPLSGDEIFHSQCWHRIAHPTEREASPFIISVLSGNEVLAFLPSIDHELSSLAVLRNDPDIIVTVLELWVCKYGHSTLWNKALTGGKKPRALRTEA
ncbi:hypothetical protein WGP40_10835 [Brachymonas sp. G13]|jgi:hypothetical protein|uniref:hypothetical protein n=1 Tax=Brachymonas TaxID=28219 RepID=UPI0012E9D4A1|nr:hypothetical protein [Brachymonas chironomi]